MASRVILASASPRRRELLALLCPDFDVIPSGVDESGEAPASPEAVAALALRKARSVAARLAAGIVLGADTVVVVDGEALGKPTSAASARAMLQRLRGRTHEVITGVAAVEAGSGRARSTAVVSRVLMRDYTDAAIEAYVAGGEPFDKAGGYAIQGAGRRLVGGVVGSYSNVIGLPLAATRELLAGMGAAVTALSEPEEAACPPPSAA